MSFELINRITIKKDGVYISTHSGNDSSPYHTVKSNYFTEKYLKGGQEELDKTIIDACFDFCELRGNHKSVIPYRLAINEAMNSKRFEDIHYKCIDLERKVIDIANKYGDYKNITDEEKANIYESTKRELNEAIVDRNNYLLNLIKENRRKSSLPKEIKEGIYEIIPVHTIKEEQEVYSEYMNLNTNNGTIIYERRLGFLMQSPDIMSVSEYEHLIMKYGIEQINGAEEYEKFKRKYPDLYRIAIENENKKIEEETEERIK